MNKNNLSEDDICDKLTRPAPAYAGRYAPKQIDAQHPLRAGRVVVRDKTVRQDANRHFSGRMRDVATGEVVTVVSRGKPVVTIGPVTRESGQRQIARQTLPSRLRQNKASGARNWTRDELNEA
ncbi:MAG: hypothetical protein Fur007_23820 [Rhodoferax sp.]